MWKNPNPPLNNEIVDERLKDRNIIRLSEYKTARLSMMWKCTICNHVWQSSADNLMNHGRGCAKCDGQLKLTNENVDEKLKNNNPLVTRAGNVIGNNRSMCKFKCDRCKNEWGAMIGNVVRNKNPSGCPICLYKRELLIMDFINKYCKENFIKTHYYKKYNNKKLYIDFYLKFYGKQVYIEYNGEQHYKPYKFKNHDNFERLKKQQARDELLRNICKKQDILLIEIPYTKTNEEIETIIKNLKDEVCKTFLT